MRKAARPSGGVDSSNLCRWRDGWLCHHGDGVCKVICAFCAVSQLMTHQSGSSNGVTLCPTLACTTPPKKNNTIHVLSNFGEVNKRVVGKPFPIPKISTVLQELEDLSQLILKLCRFDFTPLWIRFITSGFLQEFFKQICWAFWWFRKIPR